jgi:hypothetical protein
MDRDRLPDSADPSGRCPRCGTFASFDILEPLPLRYDSERFLAGRDGGRDRIAIEQVSVLFCTYCRAGTAVVEEQRKEKVERGTQIVFRGIHWWPIPSATVSGDVPADIAGVFAEAATALAASCPRAAAVMGRRTLEAITVEKGYTAGTLHDRLKALAAGGILPPALLEWSTEVRLVGNAGAHFDPAKPVARDDAAALVGLLAELLKHLYEIPAEIARRKAKSSPA